MGKDTRTKGDLLVEVTLGETEVTELELGRDVVAQIGVHDTQRVEVGDMVSTNLIRANQELHLGEQKMSAKLLR